MGELDGFMRRNKKVDGFVERFFSMGPYHKDVKSNKVKNVNAVVSSLSRSLHKS